MQKHMETLTAILNQERPNRLPASVGTIKEKREDRMESIRGADKTIIVDKTSSDFSTKAKEWWDKLRMCRPLRQIVNRGSVVRKNEEQLNPPLTITTYKEPVYDKNALEPEDRYFSEKAVFTEDGYITKGFNCTS